MLLLLFTRDDEAPAPLLPVVARLAVRPLLVAGLACRRTLVVRLRIDGGDPALTKSVIAGEALEVAVQLRTPAGAPVTAATGVQLRAQPPGGAAVRTYPVAPGTAPGEWVATVLFDLPGRWWLLGECAGPMPAVAQDPIVVAARAVPP